MIKKITIIALVSMVLIILFTVPVMAVEPEFPFISQGHPEVLPPTNIVQPYYLYYKRADGIYTLITDDEPFYILQTNTFTNRYILSSTPTALVAPDSTGFNKNYRIFRNSVGSPNTWNEITEGTNTVLHGFRLRDSVNDPETDTYNLWVYTDKFYASTAIYGVNRLSINPNSEKFVFFYNSHLRDWKVYSAVGNLMSRFGRESQILLVVGLILLAVMLVVLLIPRLIRSVLR